MSCHRTFPAYFWAFVLCALLSADSVAQESTAPAAPKEAATARAELFPLTDIRLLGGPPKRQQDINRQYLLKLAPDRLLSWFRREAGLDPSRPNDVEMIPFYQNHFQRYAVYWRIAPVAKDNPQKEPGK